MRPLRLRRLFSVEKHLRRETTIAQQHRQRQPFASSPLYHSLHFVSHWVGRTRSRDAEPWHFHSMRSGIQLHACKHWLPLFRSLSLWTMPAVRFAHFRQIRRWKNGSGIAQRDRQRWGERGRESERDLRTHFTPNVENTSWMCEPRESVERLCVCVFVFAERVESHPYTFRRESASHERERRPNKKK